MGWSCDYGNRLADGPRGSSGAAARTASAGTDGDSRYGNWVRTGHRSGSLGGLGGGHRPGPPVLLPPDPDDFQPPVPPLYARADYRQCVQVIPIQEQAFAQTLTSLYLLLHAAELAFIKGDHTTAAEMLDWLRELTSGTATTPAVSATALIELDPILGTSGATVAEFKNLHERTKVLRNRLGAGDDPYGFPARFVPLVAFETYDDKIEDVLSITRALEAAHEKYFTVLGDQVDARNQLSNTVRELAILNSRSEQEANTIANNVASLERRIDELLAELVLMTNALRAADEAFRAAVAAKAQCGFQDVLVVAGAIASIFAGGAGVVAGIGGLAAYESEKYTDTEERFKYLQDKFSKVQGGVKEIRDGYVAIKDIADRNPDAAKIQINPSDFEKVLGEFENLPEAQAYRELLRQYTTIAVTRNNLILQVDSLVREYYRIRVEIEQRTHESVRVQDVLANRQNPTIGEYRSWMRRSLASAKQELIRALYMAHRAFVYWAVAETPFIVADDTVTHLADTHSRLKTETLREMERRNGELQEFSTPTNIRLTRAESPHTFAAFEATNRLTFKLKPSEQIFSGLAYLLVAKATITLVGARTSIAYFRVRLFHHGDATIVSRDGTAHAFVHIPRVVVGDAPVAAPTVTIELGGAPPRYAYLSPFATWTVELYERDNPGLDLSGVSEVAIAFSGFAQPLA